MMLRRRIRSRTLRVLALGGIGAAAATGSYAYWTASRTEGVATAVAGSMQQVRVIDARFTKQLRPDGPAVPLVVTVSNPNPFDVQITDASAASITSDTAGCGGPDHPSGVVVDLAALRGVVRASSTTTFDVAASMTDESVSTCQGARFAASIELEVRQ